MNILVQEYNLLSYTWSFFIIIIQLTMSIMYLHQCCNEASRSSQLRRFLRSIFVFIKTDTNSVFIPQQAPFLGSCFVDSRIGCVLCVELFHFPQKITFFEMQNHNSNSNIFKFGGSVFCQLFFLRHFSLVSRQVQTDR